MLLVNYVIDLIKIEKIYVVILKYINILYMFSDFKLNLNFLF